jgi:hypothetical protein
MGRRSCLPHRFGGHRLFQISQLEIQNLLFDGPPHAGVARGGAAAVNDRQQTLTHYEASLNALRDHRQILKHLDYQSQGPL